MAEPALYLLGRPDHHEPPRRTGRALGLGDGKDYVANGFVARSKAEEIAGPDYEVWITRSCEDVSEEVLKVLRAEPDPLKRANRVRDVRQEMARAREAAVAGTAQASGLRCEVQEMWAQKTYVMFTYERLRDVRIVYVPPFSLGCFGGDTDNFEWPRHTADFTLLRAYVAPDGTAAEPSPENVPYQPSRYLRASKSGVAPDDFVFLLGFPGSTMRYAPASRLSYSDDVAVPALVSDFAQKLRLIHEHSTSRAAALKLIRQEGPRQRVQTLGGQEGDDAPARADCREACGGGGSGRGFA